MRNIFHFVALLLGRNGIISIAHIILLQTHSQEILRAGQLSANWSTNFQQLFDTKLHENIQITLVNILTLLCNLMIKRITKNINVFATRKKCYFLLLYYIKGEQIYFQASDFSGGQLYLRARPNMQNVCAQNQSVRPVETQLETLIFVFYHLNRLAAFILNVFYEKYLQCFCSLNVASMSKTRCAL